VSIGEDKFAIIIWIFSKEGGICPIVDSGSVLDLLDSYMKDRKGYKSSFCKYLLWLNVWEKEGVIAVV
jgi:hypothetical protein